MGAAQEEEVWTKAWQWRNTTVPSGGLRGQAVGAGGLGSSGATCNSHAGVPEVGGGRGKPRGTPAIKLAPSHAQRCQWDPRAG